MSRLFMTVLTLVLIITGAFRLSARAETADQQSLEGKTDRPGGDYKRFGLRPQPPGSLVTLDRLCSQACDGDNQCRAWTLVNAGIQGPLPQCWLKNTIPASKPSGYCTSGVAARPFEPGIDRPGYDYSNFDLAAADPSLCSARCQGDAQCQAWTYVNPGVQGPLARCWMKNVAPAANLNGCCTSGVPDRPVVVR